MFQWVKKIKQRFSKSVPDTDVKFSILIPRAIFRDELRQQLASLNITITCENERTSDYITCVTPKNNFCEVFNVALEWRTHEVGSWEIKTKDSGSIPENLDVKEVLLHRDILFPYGFIKNTTISRKK